PPLALARPGLPRRFNAVAYEARTERWYQYSAYAVPPVGDLVRLRVDEQRLADIEPGERDIFVVRLDLLSPKVARVSSLGKRRIRTGDRCVGKFGIEHALYSRLQPPRHRDVVGIDAPAAFRQFALEVEDVAGPSWRKDNPPIARICRVRIAILQAQADKWVLARKDRFVGIGNAHLTGLRSTSRGGLYQLKPAHWKGMCVRMSAWVQPGSKADIVDTRWS